MATEKKRSKPAAAAKPKAKRTAAKTAKPGPRAKRTAKIKQPVASAGTARSETPTDWAKMIVDQLVDAGLINSITDLYRLNLEKLLTLERMGASLERSGGCRHNPLLPRVAQFSTLRRPVFYSPRLCWYSPPRTASRICSR